MTPPATLIRHDILLSSAFISVIMSFHFSMDVFFSSVFRWYLFSSRYKLRFCNPIRVASMSSPRLSRSSSRSSPLQPNCSLFSFTFTLLWINLFPSVNYVFNFSSIFQFVVFRHRVPFTRAHQRVLLNTTARRGDRTLSHFFSCRLISTVQCATLIPINGSLRFQFVHEMYQVIRQKLSFSPRLLYAGRGCMAFMITPVVLYNIFEPVVKILPA